MKKTVAAKGAFIDVVCDAIQGPSGCGLALDDSDIAKEHNFLLGEKKYRELFNSYSVLTTSAPAIKMRKELDSVEDLFQKGGSQIVPTIKALWLVAKNSPLLVKGHYYESRLYRHYARSLG